MLEMNSFNANRVWLLITTVKQIRVRSTDYKQGLEACKSKISEQQRFIRRTSVQMVRFPLSIKITSIH